MRPSAASRPETTAAGADAFAADVRAGLVRRPRRLEPHWLYDPVGSALFDVICRLPWYPITRAETTLIERHAADIAGLLGHVTEVIELGPGSGDKLARLVAPLARHADVLAQLVDVSDDALDTAERTLLAVPRVRVVRHNTSFEDGLRDAAAAPRRGRRIVAFLGSNVGNFDPAAAERLMGAIAGALDPGDGLLLGVDLVKSAAALQLAYDDPLGVTAAFNRNLLVRMNRELGADFDLPAFRHEARWNAAASRVEMHLVATAPQRVHIPASGLVIDIDAGESIWTESSHKYSLAEVSDLGARAGLRVASQWVDRGAGFALTLYRR